MGSISFDGQQTDERVLSVIDPHPFRLISSIVFIAIADILICIFFLALANTIPFIGGIIRMFAIPITIIFGLLGILWVFKTQYGDKTYITDRRIIRFDVVTPFFINKRSLFWNEVLKVKGYSKNMILRLMNVGEIRVEPIASDGESIIVTDVYYYEHLANYVDKILFAFKNKPEEISSMKAFIAKPKGQRDIPLSH
jgi:hypothetical protein